MKYDLTVVITELDGEQIRTPIDPDKPEGKKEPFTFLMAIAQLLQMTLRDKPTTAEDKAISFEIGTRLYKFKPTEVHFTENQIEFMLKRSGEVSNFVVDGNLRLLLKPEEDKTTVEEAKSVKEPEKTKEKPTES